MVRTILLGLCILSGPGAYAHGLEYSVEQGSAVIVRMLYPDGRAYSSKAYEIFRAGEDVHYQTGHTDRQGRVVFLPDRAGSWRIKTYSEDGHGLSIDLKTDAAHGLGEVEQPLFERYAQPLVGLGILLGLFGLISLFYRGRSA